jgi:hypothetical protein
MSVPPNRAEFNAAPPSKRANPEGTPVRLYDGSLVAHVNQELDARLIECGAAEAFRKRPRRYLRLRRGIGVERTGGGWDVVEFIRKFQGDTKAAAYIGHKDRLSERLVFQSPLRPEPRTKG